MKYNRIKAVIFDMDGTLFSTEALYRDAWEKALADMQLYVPSEVQGSLVGRHITDCKRLLKAHLPCEKTLDKLCEQTDAYFMAHVHRHEVPIKKGVVRFLQSLYDNEIPCAVATNADHERAILKFKKAKLDHYFKVVVGSDQVQHPKPAPDVFLQAASVLGVAPEDCVAIEDSSVGVEAAYQAGMKVVLVPDMEIHSESSLLKVHATYDCLDEAMAALMPYYAMPA
jgi:HAD superfamily hydrolase (TIGR01509 family)